MKNRVVVFLLAAIFCFPLLAQRNDGMSIPLNTLNAPVASLRSLVDQNLEKQLLKKLKSNSKWSQLIEQKKLAVGLVDLSNPNLAKFARVNGNEMMYAASLPKIAVLFAAMDALEEGELKETREVLNDMRIMISHSDNQASTRMIDRLGYQKIEDVLTDPQYALYDEDFGGGLWVGKRYAASGERHPDPMKGLSHAATVAQVCRFYYLLVQGQLVNYQRSKQMLDMMVDPALHHKFVSSLDQIAPRAKLFRKSGSWRDFHSDSILVWGPQRRYILVALTEDPEGEKIMRELVYAVEEVLYPKS